MRRQCSFTLAIAFGGILGMAGASAQMPTQRVPDAVIADSPRHPTAPAQLAVLTFPSHGVDLDAMFYLAAGEQPHGTVILLHGLPGHEVNGDLAQSIRRAGWNVLLFHYRGTWGDQGKFSFSSAIEDTAAALRFLRDPATAKRYRIDTNRLVLIGHSFGGPWQDYMAVAILKSLASG